MYLDQRTCISMETNQGRVVVTVVVHFKNGRPVRIVISAQGPVVWAEHMEPVINSLAELVCELFGEDQASFCYLKLEELSLLLPNNVGRKEWQQQQRQRQRQRQRKRKSERQRQRQQRKRKSERQRQSKHDTWFAQRQRQYRQQLDSSQRCGATRVPRPCHEN